MSFAAFEAVGEAFRLAKRNVFAVLGITLIYGAGVVALLFLTISPEILTNLQSPSPGRPDAVGSVLLGMAGATLLYFAGILAAISHISHDAVSKPAHFGASLGRGLTALPAALVLSILLGVIVTLVLGLPLFVMDAVLMDSPAGIAFMGALVFGLGLWVAAVFQPLFPALLVEHAGIGALGRSLSMTTGVRWPIAGGMIVMGLAIFLVAFLGSLLISMLAPAAALGGGSVDMMAGSMIVILALNMLLGAFVSALGISYQAAVYAQLHTRT